MPRKPPSRIVRTVTDRLWERDRRQMRAIDALLSAGTPARRRTTRAPLQRAARRWAGFRSVLCAVDFSEPSRRALRYAEAVARRGRAVLTVMYVNDPLLIAAAAAALNDRQLARRSEGELRRFIASTLTRRSRTPLRVKTQVSIGNPADEILEAARKGRADLIVLGTHGATGARRILMGSTTLSVLRRATVPVLAVPRTRPHLAGRPSRSWPGERIVAAVNLDGAGRDADVASRIAGWLGSSLLLVHAGRVAHDIAAVAAAERAALVITVLQDRRGWLGTRRGSTSYHVLTHSTAPVLACPPGWRPR